MIDIIELTLAEDAADNDLSGQLVTSDNTTVSAVIVLKQDWAVLSGLSLVKEICKRAQLELDLPYNDGERVVRGDVVASIHGNARMLLGRERVILNFLGHLSGVATMTRQFVDAVEGTGTVIKDTRKTMPLLRSYERAAVQHGGGVNHRYNLQSMVMLKENHLRAAGGIEAGIAAAKAAHLDVYEVETTNLDEVDICLSNEVPRIMLDNFDLNDTRAAVQRCAGSGLLLEASGNMTLERVRAVAECGVDEISIGAITHSVPSVDVSMLFDWS